MRESLHFDYATVGHVTVDALEGGRRRAGGTAFYSALQAARLGLRTLVLTRGNPRELSELLAPYADELTLHVEAAEETTTLQTRGEGEARRQRMLAWAGPMQLPAAGIDADIVHLAPVAAELRAVPPGGAFVGLTAQGLLRRWQQPGGEVTLAPAPLAASAIAARCHALVLSARERDTGQLLIAAAGQAGATVVVTAGAQPNTILLPGGASVEHAVPRLSHAREDLGAGDVFAAALFVALARGEPPERAATLANAAAAVRMSGEGAGAIGDLRAIDARVLSEAGAR